MKKNILITSFAATAALLLSVSCTKQDLSQQQTESVVEGGTFTAVIEQNFTKTTLTDELKVLWENGDKICVNGMYVYSAVPKIPANKALFYPVKDEAPEDEVYQVYYPENILKDGVGFLPYKQVYRKGSLNTPMYAQSYNYSKELSFQNICGVLRFALSGTEKVKSISVTTAGELVCGPFNVRTKDSGRNTEWIAVPNGDVYDSALWTVTLDCGDHGVQLATDKPTFFYIALPPQRYKSGMTITVTRADNTTFKQKTVKDIIIERNAIYNLDWNVDKSVNETLAQFFKDMVKDQAALAAATDEATKANPETDPAKFFLPQIHTWENAHSAIKAINKALERLWNEELDDAQKKQKEGELRFFRSLLYFELFRTYGCALNAEENQLLDRGNVFAIIEEGVKMSRECLPQTYDSEHRLITLEEGIEVTRPTKWAAEALSARAYLYASSPLFALDKSGLQVCIANCKDIINNGVIVINNVQSQIALVPQYSDLWGENAFNNSELIFGVRFTTPSSAYNGMHPTSWLYTQFDEADTRRESTIQKADSGFNLNKPVTKVLPVFRFAEILLICAEANFLIDNKNDAADFNKVRNRAGLSGVGSLTDENIKSERLKELAFEDHRFWDVRRWYVGKKFFENIEGSYREWSDSYNFYPVPDERFRK